VALTEEEQEVEEAERAEREDLPYDVEVALAHLSSATDRMVERWQDRGWDTSAVADKLREELESIGESL
jgi:hypothetical protein